MENNNQNTFSENQEPIEQFAWYAQRKYFYLIILIMLAGGTVATYFIVNQPQDLGPIVINHQPNAPIQIPPATTTPTSEQITTTTSSTPPEITDLPKKVPQSTKDSSIPANSVPVKNDVPAPAPTPVISVERLVYSNTQYGFSLSFPPTWKGYTVTTENIPGTAGVLGFGFAQQKSIFTVVAYTRKMWDSSKHDDLTYYLGENSSYSFIYNPALGGANQTMSDRLAELKSILATFSSK